MTAWHDKTKSSLPVEANEIISKFLARKKMQDKYINQVKEKIERAECCVCMCVCVLGSVLPVSSSYSKQATGREGKSIN